MKQLDGMNLLDINDLPFEFTKLPVGQKLVLIVLLLTLRDKATELRFEP